LGAELVDHLVVPLLGLVLLALAAALVALTALLFRTASAARCLRLARGAAALGVGRVALRVAAALRRRRVTGRGVGVAGARRRRGGVAPARRGLGVAVGRALARRGGPGLPGLMGRAPVDGGVRALGPAVRPEGDGERDAEGDAAGSDGHHQ